MNEAHPDVARASAWMALGTVVSRLTGFARLMLLVWAIGTSTNADLFNTANTLPNSLYILVAGGVFNVVLVPQLVRAAKVDADGGEAYAQRVITLALVVLLGATAALMLAVPWLVHLVYDSWLFKPEFAAQQHDLRVLMWLCLPQIFFYGAFVLVGQVLNARGRFGPMMWAPIVNNVIACTVLLAYIAAFGTHNGSGGFTPSQTLLLGIGSTVGIAAQTAVLLPYLRRAGFRFQPRFDFRGGDSGGGLGKTLALGAWTLGFILVNQIAFVFVNRLATGGNLAGAAKHVEGSGSAVYEVGFLISQVPHGVVTVSLATAIIPALSAAAADRQFDRLRLDLARTIRLCLVLLMPLATAVACLGHPLGGVLALGAAEGKAQILGWTISAFALALVTFSTHYLVIRGFYADEDTRTPFLIQVLVAGSNIGLAYALVRDADPAHVAARLALAFGLAYGIGLVCSATVLSRRIGTLLDRDMLTFLGRLVLASAAAGAVMAALGTAWSLHTGPTGSIGVVTVAGLAGAGVFLLAARLSGLREVGYLLTTLARKR